jgi:acyl carrier protein
MGLDGIELVMALEEEFGVVISDADAAGMLTPRHVIDHIRAALEPKADKVCRTQHSYYEVRRAMISCLGVPRQAIAPGRSMNALIPRVDRQQDWQRLRLALPKLRLPNLERPRWLLQMILWGSLALAIWWARKLSGSQDFPVLFCAWIFGFLFMLVAGFVLTCPLAIQFPLKARTLRRLILNYTPARVAHLVTTEPTITRAHVAASVQRIVIEQLGLKPTNYREDARFVEDFGMD